MTREPIDAGTGPFRPRFRWSTFTGTPAAARGDGVRKCPRQPLTRTSGAEELSSRVERTESSARLRDRWRVDGTFHASGPLRRRDDAVREERGSRPTLSTSGGTWTEASSPYGLDFSTRPDQRHSTIQRGRSIADLERSSASTSLADSVVETEPSRDSPSEERPRSSCGKRGNSP